MVKKKPKIGGLLTLNMAKRSHDTTKPAARPSRSVVNVNPITESPKKYYQSFNDLCKRVKTLKTLNDWIVQELEDRLVLKKKSSQVMLPEIQIMIDDSLGFTIYVYGWLLPEDHELYTTNLRSVTNITVSDLVKSIGTLSICPGVKPFELSSSILHHVIPKSVDPLLNDDDDDGSFPHHFQMVHFHIKNIGELIVVQFCLIMANSVVVVIIIHINLNSVTWQSKRN